METKNKNKKKKMENNLVETKNKMKINSRGRIFEGKVIRKFPKRITIEFKRITYVKKYERYSECRTRIAARLPESLEKEINIGDKVKVQECRPLSKTIHFITLEKLNENGGKNEAN